MSMVKTILRLCAVEALRPSAAAPAGPWPTIAGPNIFDAKMDTYDDIVLGNRVPVVAVYTDDDMSTSGQTGGGPPFRREIDICFELAVSQLAPDPLNPDTFIPGIPVTDPEAEASLDLLEASIRYCLTNGPTGFLFRKITGGSILSIRCSPNRTAEEAVRLALRSMTVKTRVNDDCFDMSGTAATGLDMLPEPVRTVAKLLPPSSYGAGIMAALATRTPVAPQPTSPWVLDAGITAHQPPADPEADPDVAFDVNIPPTT